MASMTWDSLLNDVRVRELMGGKPSSRNDHRSQFQRDFDRVVFSSPVRRLQDKTQVFPLDPSDAVRTRLTHSLEVSAVARGLADKACKLLGPNWDAWPRRLDVETIAATAGLVHDLGNPPFGHFGESAIGDWFKEGKGAESLAPLTDHPELAADFLKFEGNARTLRLLCSLQILTDQYGLNLTAGTVSATMNYTASGEQVLLGRDRPMGQAGKKPGFLFAERHVVERVREVVQTGTARNPIAFLVEAADDCVYSLCDVEDGVKKGILSWDDLCDLMTEGTQKNYPAYVDALKALLGDIRDSVASDLAANNVRLLSQSLDYARAQWLRIKGATLIVDGAAEAFFKNYDAIMRGEYAKALVEDPAAGLGGAIVAACKYAGRTRVYNTRQTIELELRGRSVLQELLTLLWPGVRDADPTGHEGKPGDGKDYPRRAWSLLSPSYRAVFAASWAGIDEAARKHAIPPDALRQYYRLLLLTDYVGGMTDTFACTLHKSLTNG